MSDTDLIERIEDVAAGPAEVERDGVRVKQPNLKDLIEADQHVKAKGGADQPRRGLRLTKLISPGMV